MWGMRGGGGGYERRVEMNTNVTNVTDYIKYMNVYVYLYIIYIYIYMQIHIRI